MIVPRDPFEDVTAEMWQELEGRWPHPERLALAFRLALDLETCEALLLGAPVDPDKVDQAELRHAQARRLVRLDFREIDLVGDMAA